jgi:hypothetical protein
MMSDVKHDAPLFSDKAFAAAWQGYNDEVIAEGAPQYQRDEMQMSFVAGALAYRSVLSVAIKLGHIEGQTITENIATLDASVDAMAEQFFTRAEGKREAESDDEPVGVHVEHFDAPNLRAEDMEDLKGVIDGFIRERSAKRAEEQQSAPLAE